MRHAELAGRSGVPRGRVRRARLWCRRLATLLLWFTACLGPTRLGFLAAAHAQAVPAGQAAQGSVPAAFGWPIELPPALTSTFAESRSGAFHAGIDVKTWGRTGYAVRALADGYVSRIRTSPWGYGRVVYQQLADGRSMVFAHLERFAPALAARVETAQEAAAAYSVDLWLKPGEMPVALGDTLAWTGASGVGPPHLPRVLRAAETRPINPLLNGFTVPDRRAPNMQAVGLIPLDVGSQVDGGHQPVVMDLRWDASARVYRADRAPLYSGRVGVALLAYDQGDTAANPLAPLRVELLVDGATRFASQFTRFSYDDRHLVSLDRTWLPHGGEARCFYNLFVRPGNRLEFYPATVQGGVLAHVAQGASDQPGPGEHLLTLSASDANGNRALAQLSVVADRVPQLSALERVEAGVWEMELADPDDDELTVVVERSAEGRDWTEVVRTTSPPGLFRWTRPAAPRGTSTPWLRFTLTDRAGARAFAVVYDAPSTPVPPQGADARGRRPPAGPPAAAAGAAPLRLSLDAHPDFVELLIDADEPLVGPPEARVGDRRMPVRQTAAGQYRSAVPLSASGPAVVQVLVEGRTASGRAVAAQVPVSQRVVRPGQAQSLAFGDRAARLQFGAQSVYQELFPQWELFVPRPAGALTPVGFGHAFAPAGVSFDQKATLELAYPPGTEQLRQLGIYATDDGVSWVFLGGEIDTAAGVVRVPLPQLGKVALLRDNEAPQVSALQPADGTRARDRWPRLSAQVADRGSGLGREQDMRLELDGTALIAEYDPDAGELSHLPRAPLAPGMHELVVTVRDMAGNQTAQTSRFRVE